MRRRAGAHRAFFAAWLINMLLRPEWPILALIMLALHLIFGLPRFLIWVCLGIWIIWSAAVTIFVSWASRCSDANPTPGGQRTSQRLREKAERERNDKIIINSREE